MLRDDRFFPRRFEMKTRALLFIAVLALTASVAASAQQVVTVTGTAAILNKDTAQARDRAIESALRAAVEQVIGSMVDSESLVKNNELLSDKIYTQTHGYISNYNILGEKPDMDTNIYSVKIEATVKQGSLQDDLNSLGVLMRRMKMPRVAVVLNEVGWTATTQLQKMLRDKGFLVVDTGERFHNEQFVREFWGMSEPAQTDLLKQYGAEVVILGNALEASAGSAGPLASYRGSVSFRALKTDTKELLGTSSFQTNSVRSPEQAIFECTNKAGREVMDQITSQWAKEASSTRVLTLELTGAAAAKANEIGKRLQSEGRGIQEAIVRDSGSGTATLNVSMQGDASDLAQEMKKLYPKAKIVSQSANRLTVSF
jgi:hypothetical protein